MKYKSLIQGILMAQVLAFIVLCSMLFTVATTDSGIDKTIKDVQDNPLFSALLIAMGILFFIAALLSVFLSTKMETLTLIETQEEQLEKEKKQYQEATEKFVKTFNIKSNDLLNQHN